MRTKILHQVAPFWRVGEERPADVSRVAILDAHAALRADEHYPGDYQGRVISVIPATCEYSPGDTADPHRRVIPLDLSDRELTDVRSRRLKVGPFGLEPVTFDDRFGAVAVKLREKHENPEAFEREEAEAVEAAEAANTADLERFDLEQLAFEIARRDYARDLVEFGVLDLGLEPPVAPVPPTPPVLIERENAFEREAVELAGALPRTVTHSGVGMYLVGSGYTETHRTSGFGTDNIYDVAHDGDSLWVAVGAAGKLFTSPDSITWTQRTSGFGTDNILGVAYGGSVWIAVGAAGKLATSADGITWTHRTSGFGTSSIFTIAYNGSNLWVAAGQAGKLATSADGTTWTSRTSGFGGLNYIAEVAHDQNALWVAVGGVGFLTTSPDGITWTARGSGFVFTPIQSVAHDASALWCIVGDSGKAATSPDGTTWTQRTSGFGTTAIYGVNWSTGNYWISVGASSKLATSPDAVTWTLQTTAFSGIISGIGGDGYGRVAAVGASGELASIVMPPYATIQSALDQLWADQGVTTFTASQYIRIFAGTYDENVAPNSGILPGYQYRLLIEGDPADDRDNIILAPSGGTVAFYASGSTAYGTFRHLHVGGSPSNYSVQTVAVAYYWNLLDCYLGKAIFLLSLIRFEDCYLVGYARTSGVSILRCVFMGSGGAGTYAIYGGGGKHMFVESCAFYNYDSIIPRWHYGTKRLYSNCTFVSATYGLFIAYAFPQFDDQTIINCIFKDVDYPVYWVQNLLWPEETTTQVGTPWVLRNNRVHGHTAFAYDGSVSKTLAEFEALNRVDAAGNVEEDALLTDPGAGDFSLQAASPCRHAGHGSVAVKDYLGTAFDAHHPDIGAWSSGALTLAAPTISSIADDGTTNSVTLSLGAENALDVLSVRYAKTSDATWTLFGSTRTGPGTLQITGLTVGWYDGVCVAARGGEVSLPSRSVRFAVVATALASPGAALNALLRADSTLAALVGDHIYPQAAPQGARVPYVVSTRVGGTPAHTMAAAAGFVEERFQIDSYGATLEDAQTIADAIRNVLDGYRGTVSAGSAQLVVGSIRRDMDIDGFTEPAFAGGVGRHRVIQDYLMTHEESVPAFA